jgi:ankyrin repeat protein
MLPQAGNTALHLAAAGGHLLVVRELLRAGADASSVNQVPAPLLLAPVLPLTTSLQAHIWSSGCSAAVGKDRQQETMTGVQTGRPAAGQADRHCGRQAGEHHTTNRHPGTVRQTNRKTDRQTHRQSGRQGDNGWAGRHLAQRVLFEPPASSALMPRK